jgi:hypothetical protein
VEIIQGNGCNNDANEDVQLQSYLVHNKVAEKRFYLVINYKLITCALGITTLMMFQKHVSVDL